MHNNKGDTMSELIKLIKVLAKEVYDNVKAWLLLIRDIILKKNDDK
tara:strand:- start:1705 stop:1842 length:138 start_codon:yes stop_codon:yes gene_type:complete